MDAPAQSRPTRRWYQRRLLRYLAVLLLAFVGAYFAWDALLTPADLRRMQGTWEVFESAGTDQKRWVGRLSISARRYKWVDGTGKSGSFHFDIDSERQEFIRRDPEQLQILSETVSLPTWLHRPRGSAVLHYQFSGANFTLRAAGVEEKTRYELVRTEQ